MYSLIASPIEAMNLGKFIQLLLKRKVSFKAGNRVFSKVLVEFDEFIENVSWLCECCYLWQPYYYQSVFMVTLLLSISFYGNLLLSISFYGNLTIINQFLW